MIFGRQPSSKSILSVLFKQVRDWSHQHFVRQPRTGFSIFWSQNQKLSLNQCAARTSIQRGANVTTWIWSIATMDPIFPKCDHTLDLCPNDLVTAWHNSLNQFNILGNFYHWFILTIIAIQFQSILTNQIKSKSNMAIVFNYKGIK